MELPTYMRRKYEQRCTDALGHADRMRGMPEHPDDGRCSGLVVCDVCGCQYYDHPPHPSAPYMTVTCNDNVVKL